MGDDTSRYSNTVYRLPPEEEPELGKDIPSSKIKLVTASIFVFFILPTTFILLVGLVVMLLRQDNNFYELFNGALWLMMCALPFEIFGFARALYLIFKHERLNMDSVLTFALARRQKTQAELDADDELINWWYFYSNRK